MEVAYVRQWPPREAEPPFLDERPDIELQMRVVTGGVSEHWYPIDIVYLREMPQSPERLKSVEQLTEDIFQKAKQHLAAMSNPNILISAVGSKYDVSPLSGKAYVFAFDEGEYITINGMRVAFQFAGKELYKPLKGSDLRSHTQMIVEEVAEATLHLTDHFNTIRTDGRKGFLCSTRILVPIFPDQIIKERQAEAKAYTAPYLLFRRIIESPAEMSS